MIEYLSGTIVRKSSTHIIMDVNGVGYALYLDAVTLYDIPAEGEKLAMWVHTRVREDVLQLYGFKTYANKELFECLIAINKVGPKLALAIMANLRLEDLLHAMDLSDSRPFEAVPGVGKTLAGKILVELNAKRKKLEMLGAQGIFKQGGDLSDGLEKWEDLSVALAGLGYKASEIESVVKALRKSGQSLELSQLIKEALRLMQGNKTNSGARVVEKQAFDIF